MLHLQCCNSRRCQPQEVLANPPTPLTKAGDYLQGTPATRPFLTSVIDVHQRSAVSLAASENHSLPEGPNSSAPTAPEGHRRHPEGPDVSRIDLSSFLENSNAAAAGLCKGCEAARGGKVRRPQPAEPLLYQTNSGGFGVRSGREYISSEQWKLRAPSCLPLPEALSECCYTRGPPPVVPVHHQTSPPLRELHRDTASKRVHLFALLPAGGVWKASQADVAEKENVLYLLFDTNLLSLWRAGISFDVSTQVCAVGDGWSIAARMWCSVDWTSSLTRLPLCACLERDSLWHVANHCGSFTSHRQSRQPCEGQMKEEEKVVLTETTEVNLEVSFNSEAKVTLFQVGGGTTKILLHSWKFQLFLRGSHAKEIRLHLARLVVEEGIACDHCNRWFHYCCARVNANVVPESDWKCFRCHIEGKLEKAKQLAAVLQEQVEHKEGGNCVNIKPACTFEITVSDNRSPEIASLGEFVISTAHILVLTGTTSVRKPAPAPYVRISSEELEKQDTEVKEPYAPAILLQAGPTTQQALIKQCITMKGQATVMVCVWDIETITTTIITPEIREDDILGVPWLSGHNTIVEPVAHRKHFGAKETQAGYNLNRNPADSLPNITLGEIDNDIPPD
ncbi:hypothetical protein PR048_026410 [Dryococelus australis]|uniref:Zinc finger PHD-type domain-containing protein n=1 Tax=Dryococelus australis TaxID=614101 RepID=A0ABQ9GL82_9NEOP|nr:hypothetical protein PR048_026410 [Dryococelus australis]